jgi:rare lipoprotein A
MNVFGRRIHAGFALLALVVILVSSCGHRTAHINVPIAPARMGATETGVASWYGVPYHGRRAASGEVYDMEQLTAAHRTLPFQTWIEVTNLSNGKQVDVRINDRGPFVKGRILDLSQAAARDIDMLRAGTAHVRLKVVPAPPLESREPIAVTAPPVAAPQPDESRVGGGYVVQVGAFSERDRAEALCAALENRFAQTRVVSSERAPALWRVVVGRNMTREQAADLAIRVRQETGAAVVVTEPGPEPAK